MIQKVIKYLIDNETPYNEIKSFSCKPGIYAIFFIGDIFPIYDEVVRKHQIIYIGKTESSQESRDEKTHFADGKSGSSTVRKSLGALLKESKKLNPIPRNNTDYSKNKYSHFKFDEKSEKIITDWMKSNLALSFFEFTESDEKLNEHETDVIKELIPILNIDSKNPNNIYKNEIIAFRKECATLAMKSGGFSRLNKKSETTIEIKQEKRISVSHSETGNFIIITNITKKDVLKNQIRILVSNKHLFPKEIKGKPMTYDLVFFHNDLEYLVSYKIGSNDKSRSGVLNFKSELYSDKLRIKEGTKIKICKTEESYFLINRL